MTIEFMILAGLIAAGVGFEEFRAHKTKKIMEAQLQALRVRQGEIARQRVSRQNPRVDAVAKTTIRDSNDLPVGGRMGQVLDRKKREVASLRDDH